MARKVYPSDISREQFAAIREMLAHARKKTNPRRVDLYEIFCAILYLDGESDAGHRRRTEREEGGHGASQRL